jgi:aryl-alcohol dehydrogenase-like predicted oxidoreductase
MRLTGEGIWGPPKDLTEATKVLKRAAELGVNFIDTADSYGPNVNEELIAEALFPYPKDLVIATKGGWNRPGPGQWTHDATPAHLRKAVEGSLKRLRLERIEVYQLHTPDPVVPFEDSVGTLAQLKNEGKIRFVALSNVTQDTLSEHVRLFLSFPFKTGTALLIASGTTLWIIVSAMESPSSHGSHWEPAELRDRSSIKSRGLIKSPHTKWQLPGC